MKQSLLGIALLALFTTACTDPAPKPTDTTPAQTESAANTPTGDTSQKTHSIGPAITKAYFPVPVAKVLKRISA